MAIEIVRQINSGHFNKITVGDNATTSIRAFSQNQRIVNLLKSAAKVGMLYHKVGTPSEVPDTAGAFCIDTTTDAEDLWVCTSRITPTWTEVTE